MIEPGLTPGEERALGERIAALPESIEPARDLWPAIQARVDTSRVRPLQHRSAAGRGSFDAPTLPPIVARQSHRQWAGVAAAAAVLISASVSLTWLAMHPANPAPAVAEAPFEGAAIVPGTALASFASYERSAADLASALELRAQRLDPATRAVLERSLRTIDEALHEARSALAADPSSAAFHSFVEAAYRQKLDFLRRANDVAALTGA